MGSNPFARLWRWARDPRNRREVWGYGIWGTMGAVVALPEIWAAADSANVPWPTISGTVGYLEYWHPWVAIIVIGILVWGGFHALRATTSARLEEERTNPEGRLVRAPGGRLSVARRAAPVPTYVYFPLALAFVVLAALAVHLDRPGDKYLFGEVLYGSIAFWWIVLPAWLAYRFGRYVPYPTLFRTIQLLERRVRVVAIVFAAGIAVLLVHLAFYPWPSVIPDLQDLHKQYAKQRHDQKKRSEPSAYSK
jgi:hypothetical protein